MYRHKSRRVIVIAKERPFDEEQWVRLLAAFAYVLHERRQATGETRNPPNGVSGDRS